MTPMVDQTTVGISQKDGILDYRDSNQIFELILDALIQSGLGKKEIDNPFRDIIKPSSSILVKPNWVHHDNLNGYGMDCMVTNPQFILSILELLQRTNPKKIIIADAPIQGCDWNKLLKTEFIQEVLSKKNGIDIEIKDLRLHKIMDSKRIEDSFDPEEYIIFDLKENSLLEPVTGVEPSFRVTMYDPSVLMKTHSKGKHQYLLSRVPFESDIIINIPKLKTHKKSGLTGALKNLVGLNGDKGYLPHHRVGGTWMHGDCYPHFSIIKSLTEKMLDEANRSYNDKRKSNRYSKTADKLLAIKRTLKGNTEIEGGWFGNDTIWRTVLDINRIVRYGRLDGTIGPESQRTVWNVTDAIVCGQGEGPLSPIPLHVGAVTSSPSAPMADAVHAAILGFNYKKIPLINNSFKITKWPISDSEKYSIRFNNESLTDQELSKILNFRAVPPQGWKGKIEME